MNLRPIPPAELPAVWGFVLPGLEEVIRKTGEKWTPTHVRQGINEGWAFLFVADDGFVVLQRLKEEWTSDAYLHVWVLWFAPTKAEQAMHELFAWLDDAMDKLGCTTWKFGSPRGGWATRRLRDQIEIERIIWRRK